MNNLLEDTENGVQIITINRPKQLNALNEETIEELHIAFSKAAENAAVKVIVLTGSGEKSFVAGADIKELAGLNVEQGKQLAAKGHETLFDFVENLRKPVIAAINGFALGGGLELAMACHLRVASDNARMGLPETTLGLIPGYGGTQRLAQLIGKGRAFELIFTAKMIDASDALRYGLVNHVVGQAELLSKCMNLAQSILKNSPVALGFAIDAINSGFMDDVNGYDVEISSFGECFGTQDFKEGTSAFIEKRKANFPGS